MIPPSPAPTAAPFAKRTIQQRTFLAYLLFILAAAIYLYPFLRPAIVPDEGELLTDAVRVTQGQVFARDFFEGMAPGTFYSLALFFKIFGITWVASRISLMLTSLSIAALLYYLSRRLQIAFAAAPVILFAGTSFGLLWPAISHHCDSTLYALLAFTLFLRALDGRRPVLLFCAGAMSGITTCFLQQKGLLLFLSFVAVLLLLERRTPRFRVLLACLTTGFAAVGLAICAFFFSAGALGSLIYANLVFPLTRYGSANSVPYGLGLFTFYWQRWSAPLAATLSAGFAYPFAALLMVPFLFVAALPFLAPACVLKLRSTAFDRITLPYWLCGAAIWLSELQRKDIWHLVYGSPLLLLLCFYLFERLPHRRPARALQFVSVCACLLAACNVFVVSTARTPITTRRGTVYAFHPDPVLAYLYTRIQPGENILAYPYRPMYYFLLAANNVTRYSFYQRGMHPSDVFQSAVDALEAGKVRHVIWDTTYEDPSMAWSFPRQIVNESIVETYLLQHYKIVNAQSGVRLLERKD